MLLIRQRYEHLYLCQCNIISNLIFRTNTMSDWSTDLTITQSSSNGEGLVFVDVTFKRGLNQVIYDLYRNFSRYSL
jgi:hypothetical protein